MVAILGVLAVIAIGTYLRQARNAKKSEVLANVSQVSLRQKSDLAATGAASAARGRPQRGCAVRVRFSAAISRRDEGACWAQGTEEQRRDGL